jgi:hypothetical protein
MPINLQKPQFIGPKVVKQESNEALDGWLLVP